MYHYFSQALTLRDAQDVIHLERLETLGDSCLKYLISVYAYTKFEDMNEGHLSILRSHLVSNKNLFCCGKNMAIGSYVKVPRHISILIFFSYSFTFFDARFNISRQRIFKRKRYGVLRDFLYPVVLQKISHPPTWVHLPRCWLLIYHFMNNFQVCRVCLFCRVNSRLSDYPTHRLFSQWDNEIRNLSYGFVQSMRHRTTSESRVDHKVQLRKLYYCRSTSRTIN